MLLIPLTEEGKKMLSGKPQVGDQVRIIECDDPTLIGTCGEVKEVYPLTRYLRIEGELAWMHYWVEMGEVEVLETKTASR